MADGGICVFGRDRDGLRTVSLRRRCIGRIRGQPGQPSRAWYSHLPGTACWYHKIQREHHDDEASGPSNRCGCTVRRGALYRLKLGAAAGFLPRPPMLSRSHPIVARPGSRAGCARSRPGPASCMVTAHPDDEDGGMLAYETRGQGARGSLLTLNRGEGGQNVMSIGSVRCPGPGPHQELLAGGPLLRRGSVFHARHRLRIFEDARRGAREMGS